MNRCLLLKQVVFSPVSPLTIQEWKTDPVKQSLLNHSGWVDLCALPDVASLQGLYALCSGWAHVELRRQWLLQWWLCHLRALKWRSAESISVAAIVQIGDTILAEIVALGNLQKCVGGFLLYKFWRIFPGIFLEDFSALFPFKNEEKKSGEKIRERFAAPSDTHLLLKEESEVNKRGRPSKWPPERLPSEFADFECAFSLEFLGENMTPKNPFLEGTFWDKFSRPIRSRALLFTPERIAKPLE